MVGSRMLPIIGVSLLVVSAFLIQRQQAKVWNWQLPTNAGTLLSVYTTARAAGATLEGDSAAELVSKLVEGVRGTGDFSTTTFRVPGMSEEEIDAALRNLRLVDGVLTYHVAEDEDP